MRIVFPTTEFVTENNYCGGLSNYINKTAKKLKNDGHDVHIVVLSKTEGTIDYEGIHVHRVDMNTFSSRMVSWVCRRKFRGSSALKHFYKRLHRAWRVNKQIKRINTEKKIDIIQYPSLAALALFRPKKNKALLRISSSSYLWKKAQNNYLFSHKIDYFLEKFAMRNMETIIAPSYLLANEFQKALKKKVIVVPTPFERKTVVGNQYGFYQCSLKNKKYFLFAGQISPHKGIDTIAEVLEDIFKVDDDLFFVFAGQNFKFDQKAMMDKIREKAGPYVGRVMYLGVLPHEELFPVVENAIAAVLPSRVDNLPNMCLEAMSLKKIVVGTKGASFDEIIQDGLNGFLVEIDNPEQLLFKLKKVLGMNEEERMLMGERAHAVIESRFGENAYKQLLELYAEITGQEGLVETVLKG